MREPPISVTGTVVAVTRGAVEVALGNGHRVRCVLCGRMMQAKIRVTVGDRVEVEMTGYDLHRGRVTRRLTPARPSPAA
jgi:translation initiation factor IF-1